MRVLKSERARPSFLDLLSDTVGMLASSALLSSLFRLFLLRHSESCRTGLSFRDDCSGKLFADSARSSVALFDGSNSVGGGGGGKGGGGGGVVGGGGESIGFSKI